MMDDSDQKARDNNRLSSGASQGRNLDVDADANGAVGIFVLLVKADECRTPTRL